MFKSIITLSILLLAASSFAVTTSPLVTVDKQTVIFSRAQNIQTPEYQNVQKQIEQAAISQAQIWGDTILEGDYASAGDTQVDEVLALYRNGSLAGYRITYSEKAWMTADCNFSLHNLAALQQCTAGRISESSFVTADFVELERDYNNLATFAEN